MEDWMYFMGLAAFIGFWVAACVWALNRPVRKIEPEKEALIEAQMNVIACKFTEGEERVGTYVHYNMVIHRPYMSFRLWTDARGNDIAMDSSRPIRVPLRDLMEGSITSKVHDVVLRLRVRHAPKVGHSELSSAFLKKVGKEAGL